MLLTQNEPSKVERRISPHMSSRTYGLPAVTLAEWLKTKRDFWGFSTRKAHSVQIVNLIRLKMVYTS